MSLNNISLMGRLSKDVELRYTQNQKPVASFSIAVERDGKDAGVDFIDIVAWNGTATMANSYFKKGDPIVVTGRLQMRNWEDKNGNKRVSAEVVADRLYFVPKTSGNTGMKDFEAVPSYGVSVGFEDIEDDGDTLPF